MFCIRLKYFSDGELNLFVFLPATSHNILPTCLPRRISGFHLFAILVSPRLRFPRHTTPSIQSVHLIGSWDNFAKRYPMERDIRRSRGQWRGCYAFEDIICDGEGGSSPKRTGGLKMGSTYYYYVCSHTLNSNSSSHFDIV